MNPSVARSYEAVTVAARRLRTHLRYAGFTIEGGVRTARLSAPVWMIRDLVDSLENSDVARADAHLNEPHERPVTGKVTKVNLPRETLDE